MNREGKHLACGRGAKLRWSLILANLKLTTLTKENTFFNVTTILNIKVALTFKTFKTKEITLCPNFALATFIMVFIQRLISVLQHVFYEFQRRIIILRQDYKNMTKSERAKRFCKNNRTSILCRYGLRSHKASIT